jgi:outer membrane protein TolC
VDDAALLSGSSDVTSRPEYAMLEAQAQVARQEVNVSRAAWLPQLGLLAYYGYTNGVKINGRKLLDSWGFAGGVTLSVPIFHFGADYFKTKAAKVKAQQVELDRENYVELMQLQLAKEGNNLEESAQEVVLTEKGLEQATLNRELSEKQYKAGTETLSDLLEAQALWQQAWQRRIEAQFRRYLASVAYLKAAGRLVEE